MGTRGLRVVREAGVFFWSFRLWKCRRFLLVTPSLEESASPSSPAVTLHHHCVRAVCLTPTPGIYAETVGVVCYRTPAEACLAAQRLEVSEGVIDLKKRNVFVSARSFTNGSSY